MNLVLELLLLCPKLAGYYDHVKPVRLGTYVPKLSNVYFLWRIILWFYSFVRITAAHN